MVSVFRHPCGHANGNMVDRAGRLVICEHGGRRVSRTEIDGTVVALADPFDGRRLNSPNDIVEKSDGSLWFTDPVYGVESDYMGVKGEGEQRGNFVYRIDPGDGRLKVVADDFVQPNGLAPDGTLLGKIKVPEVVANVCFGGPKRNYLYMCATTSLYGVRLPVRGARTF